MCRTIGFLNLFLQSKETGIQDCPAYSFSVKLFDSLAFSWSQRRSVKFRSHFLVMPARSDKTLSRFFHWRSPFGLSLNFLVCQFDAKNSDFAFLIPAQILYYKMVLDSRFHLRPDLRKSKKRFSRPVTWTR